MSNLTTQTNEIILRKLPTEPQNPGSYTGIVDNITGRFEDGRLVAYIANFIVSKNKIPCGTKSKWFNLKRKADVELWNKFLELLDLDDEDSNEAIGKKVGIEITANIKDTKVYLNISDFFELKKKNSKVKRKVGDFSE